MLEKDALSKARSIWIAFLARDFILVLSDVGDQRLFFRMSPREDAAPHCIPLPIGRVLKEHFVRPLEVVEGDRRKDVMHQVVAIIVPAEEEILDCPTMAVTRHEKALIL